jgi:hypothetical protein
LSNASHINAHEINLPDDVDKESLLNDQSFFRASAIKSLEEIAGKEKNLLALRNTYKNIQKAE